MKIQSFIFNWPGHYTQAQQLEQRLLPLGHCNVVNSDPDNIPSHWLNIGNHAWFTQQWLTACQHFQGDIMFHVQADACPENIPQLFQDCLQYQQQYNWGIYSPNLDFTPHTSQQADITSIKLHHDHLKMVNNPDCTCWFLHGDVIDDFNKLAIDWSGNTIGWGIDYIMVALSYMRKRPVIRDYNHLVDHPRHTNYTGDAAWTQMQHTLRQCPAELLDTIHLLMQNRNQIVKFFL